jgi:hypothetical protein
MPVTTKMTHFPNGIAQYTFAAIGAAAGVLTCTGVVLATDRLLHARADTLNATTGCITASADLTSETTITADNQITTTSTSTAGKNFLITIARASA